MKDATRLSFRPTQELFEKLNAEDNAGEVIRTALSQYYSDSPAPVRPPGTTPPIKGLIKTRSGRPLVLPIGDILMKGQVDRERLELWWCPDEHIDAVRTIAADFNGCELCIGEDGNGAEYMPEVITEEWQERKRNGSFTPSCRMDEALIGDRLLWLNIVDAEMALKTFDTKTHIPCPVRIDVIKYSDDNTYKLACNKGNELFRYYYKNNRPYDTSAVDTHASAVNRLYDLD